MQDFDDWPDGQHDLPVVRPELPLGEKRSEEGRSGVPANQISLHAPCNRVHDRKRPGFPWNAKALAAGQEFLSTMMRLFFLRRQSPLEEAGLKLCKVCGGVSTEAIAERPGRPSLLKAGAQGVPCL